MKNTRVFEIIHFLLTTRSSSKIIHAAITGNYSKKQISNTLSDLKRRGIVEYHDDFTWSVTEKGKTLYKEKGGRMVFRYFSLKEEDEKEKEELIIIFDIPEKERRKRDWLRSQLKLFDFEQIQKSVWLGPDRLPKEFFAYLEELGIRGNIKIFRTNGRT